LRHFLSDGKVKVIIKEEIIMKSIKPFRDVFGDAFGGVIKLLFRPPRQTGAG
jgi:hypothetical protein